MNGKHLSQLKKPMDSQEENDDRFVRNSGFATQGQTKLLLEEQQ